MHRLIEGKSPIISGVMVSMASRDSLEGSSPWGLGWDRGRVTPWGCADPAADGLTCSLGPLRSHGRAPFSPSTEGHLVAHCIPAHGHDQVHGLPQGTLRPIRQGQRQGGPCGPGGMSQATYWAISTRAPMTRRCRVASSHPRSSPSRWGPCHLTLHYIPLLPGEELKAGAPRDRGGGSQASSCLGPGMLLSHPQVRPRNH